MVYQSKVVGHGRIVTWIETSIAPKEYVPVLKKESRRGITTSAKEKRNCSKERLQQLIELGMRNSEIEKELRLSSGYVRKLLIRHGITNPNSERGSD